jgi:ABC-2 type transport system permease protein
VNTFRYGILGVSDISVGFAYSMIIGFIAILFSFSLYLLKTGKGIRQ